MIGHVPSVRTTISHGEIIAIGVKPQKLVVVEMDASAETVGAEIAETTTEAEAKGETIAAEIAETTTEAEAKGETIGVENAETTTEVATKGETIVDHRGHRTAEKGGLCEEMQRNPVVGGQKRGKADLGAAETQHGVFI